LASNPFKAGSDGGRGAAPGAGGSDVDPLIDGPNIPIEELISLVRHSKIANIKEALDYMPNKKFDKTLVQVLFYQCRVSLVVCMSRLH
jgi:hypothetical protein